MPLLAGVETMRLGTLARLAAVLQVADAFTRCSHRTQQPPARRVASRPAASSGPSDASPLQSPSDVLLAKQIGAVRDGTQNMALKTDARAVAQSGTVVTRTK